MTYLEEIVRLRREDLARDQASTSRRELQAVVQQRERCRDFLAALHAKPPALIAEIKRASPSAGIIAANCDPAQIALQYEAGGAAAISVLTEARHFGGSFEDLAAVRAAVGLPILCKDFIIDEFQVWRAVASGADAVLLIAALLDDRMLASLIAACDRLGVSALVEIHSEHEVGRVIEAGARLIGVNNRDLRSLGIDRNLALRTRKLIPAGHTTVAESGYESSRDIAAAAEAGFDAVLVGEALMRAADRTNAVRELVRECA